MAQACGGAGVDAHLASHARTQFRGRDLCGIVGFHLKALRAGEHHPMMWLVSFTLQKQGRRAHIS